MWLCLISQPLLIVYVYHMYESNSRRHHHDNKFMATYNEWIINDFAIIHPIFADDKIIVSK